MNAKEQALWDNVVQRPLGTSTNEPKEATTMANAVIDARRAYFATSAHTPPRIDGEKSTTFDEGLVERLASSYLRAESPGAKSVGLDAKVDITNGIRAVLAELASMPVEMPTPKDIMLEWIGTQGITVQERAHVAHIMFRSRLGPILAAKDAEIARLENLRVDADEKHAVAQRYISELEKRLADKDRHMEAIRENNIWQTGRIGELERALAERTPVEATGKTPGQVGFEAWQKRYASIRRCQVATWAEETPDCQECEEAGAKAVLRTFGGAEALRRVREQIEHELDSDRALEIIDAELAKLPSAPSLTVPIKPTKPVEGIGDALAQSFGVGKPDDVTLPPRPGVFMALGVCDECGGLGSHRPWCKT